LRVLVRVGMGEVREQQGQRPAEAGLREELDHLAQPRVRQYRRACAWRPRHHLQPVCCADARVVSGARHLEARHDLCDFCEHGSREFPEPCEPGCVGGLRGHGARARGTHRARIVNTAVPLPV